MARKSNKTAHVLNLIAGQDTKNDKAEETTSAAEAEASFSDTDATPSVTAAPAQTISVIDTTEDDPVAELIHQQLSNAFEAQMLEVQEAASSVAEPEPEVVYEPEITAAPEAEAEPEPEIVYEPEITAAPEAVSEPEPEVVYEPEITAAPETAAEPEPDFTSVNVMEIIVKDKIIYFMRQFDVCTCDRCIADTVALTLNGLTPKYIITEPSAVDPLISFYTNKYISDITVEATKACITVKDNPRH